MKRRDAIKTLGALVGTAATSKLLAGCSSDDGPEQAVGLTTLVTVMMENRSYDHYMGARSFLEGLPGDGLTASLSNPNLAAQDIPPYRESYLTLEEDPAHGWDRSHQQWNGGANDGFVTVHQDIYGESVDPHPMGYLAREELPFLYAMADSGASCDRWFSSVMGPTWPNRMYLLSGQSNGRINNDPPSGGGFDWPTIFNLLDDAGIDWVYYFSDVPFLPLWKTVEVEGRARYLFPDFFDAAAAGTLPPVVFIEPSFTSNDDHPPHHPILGQQFLSSIYAALAASPQWNNLMLTVTYDENGGFFDHVPPPTVEDDRVDEGFGQLGFRVPAVSIGPYVKPGHVSSVVRDHSSVLAEITNRFGLAPITTRVGAANDLSELLDLDRLARGEPLPAPQLPIVEVDESMLRAAVLQRRSHPVDVERALASGHLDRRWDRRRETLDLLYGIGDVLERLGRGRIRRGR